MDRNEIKQFMKLDREQNGACINQVSPIFSGISLRDYLEYEQRLGVTWHLKNLIHPSTDKYVLKTKQQAIAFHRKYLKLYQERLRELITVKDEELEAYAYKNLWTSWYAWYNSQAENYPTYMKELEELREQIKNRK